MTRVKHCALALIVVIAAAGSYGQVAFERIANAAKEPQNWLTYSGDYAGRHFSPLDQINTTNARSLVAKWVYQTAATGKFETTPLVVDGILYATGQDDRAFALDARTGRPIWMYQRQLPSDIRPCCGRVNRGLAIMGDKVFLGTLDAHLVALDGKTGNVVWDVAAADYRTGHSFTVAPLAVKNLIVIGVSGGEYGVRGFIDAYDADTGARKWRFYTVPGPGEAGHDSWEGDSWKVGGAPAWNTGTYDSATNQIFWPTGNPAPSTLEGHTVCPGALGTTNFMPPTYDPQTGMFYVTARDQCDIFSTAPQPYEGGHAFYGSAYFPSEEARPYLGFLKAIDPVTGETKMKFQHTSPTWSGVLSTAGGLVFSGDAEGNLIAFDAASLKLLWHFQMGGAVYAAPMAFAVNGKEYLAIAEGSGGYGVRLQ